MQDVMIEDLQRQVVELTQCLAAQNLEMYCDIDCHNSKSNFENPYHKPVLFLEQRVRDERHEDLNFRVKFVDEEFQHEEEAEDSSQCFVDWNSPPTYDIYVDDEDLIEVEENFIFKDEN
jgi:hypothetical protein